MWSSVNRWVVVEIWIKCFVFIFKGQQSSCSTALSLKINALLIFRNFSNHSAKITASIPRCPESPDSSLGRPHISQIPALSLYCFQKLTLILTALLSHDVLRFSVLRGKMPNIKPEQIAEIRSNRCAFA
jgi:hypothetical protein